jgi:hypothetical protein
LGPREPTSMQHSPPPGVELVIPEG